MTKLSLVPTPIGNMDDITLRAIKVLKEAEAILCEDTRHSRKLMAHHGINTPLVAFHQHNEHRLTPQIVNQLKGGRQLAMISDAGTPGISDAGFLLVRACIKEDIPVECLPGATAVIPAIVGSGLPCDRFVYMGFPPQKKGRQKFWLSLAEETRTMVMYESPHRIQKALEEAAGFFGPQRQACVVRELTKVYETYHRGSLSELIQTGAETPYKGEIVLVIAGKDLGDKDKEE